MAKRLKLKVDYFEGYHLLSIVSHLKDYRLSYFINEALDTELKKYNDLQLTDREGTYSWFFYNEGENHPSFYLVSTSHVKGNLIPSQRGIDYYFFIKELYDDDEAHHLAELLRKIDGVLGVFLTDMATIKNMDSIIESIELHEMENIKRSSSRKAHR